MSRIQLTEHRLRFEHYGFSATATGTYRLNGMLLQPTPRWLAFSSPAQGLENPLTDLHGAPGLWKLTQARTAGKYDREFHLPLSVLNAGDFFDAEHDRDLTRECVDWAMATLHRRVPDGWVTPDGDEIRQAIPQGGLTLQAGPIVRQGSLVCTPHRLALVFPIVRDVPAQLPGERLQLLNDLAIDAQNRWRMVRIGWSGTAQARGIEAEVDLTGAPHAVIEQLVPVSVDALRWVVQWIVSSAALLADIRVDCRLSQCCVSGHGPRKGDALSC